MVIINNNFKIINLKTPLQKAAWPQQEVSFPPFCCSHPHYCTYSPIIAPPTPHRKHLGLANGIVSTGSAVSTILLPLLLRRTLSSNGLHFTLRLLAVGYASLVVCIATWCPIAPPPTTQSPTQPTSGAENATPEAGVIGLKNGKRTEAGQDEKGCDNN